MSASAIILIILNKVPDVIKVVLFQAAENCTTWSSFRQRAEKISIIAYPDKSLQRIEGVPMSINSATTAKQKGNFYSDAKYKPRGRKKAYCDIHGECTHRTEECRTIIALKKKGWYKQRNVLQVQEEDIITNDEGQEPLTKANYAYSSFMSSEGNPFFINGKIFGKEIKILVDTGADVSIVLFKIFTIIPKLQKYHGNVITASGDRLKIKGRVEKMSIVIDDHEITFSPLITEDPIYTILGADVIKEHLNILNPIINTITKSKKDNKHDLNINNKQCENEILLRYKDIFADTIASGHPLKGYRHKIQTGNAKPIYERNYKIPVHYEKEISKFIESGKKQGILRECNSPWCSRIIPVPKKNGQLRICNDYRPLNRTTIKDRFSLPNISSILDRLSGATIFTTLDATSGYYQIELSEEDKCKTAFAWKGRLYEYNRMPFIYAMPPPRFSALSIKF